MTNRQNGKIRFVKCPKCARILEEPEYVSIYTCGGCNTILQAKYYKRHKVAPLLTEDVVQGNGNGHARDIRESSGSSKRSCSSGEQSPIKNKENDEKDVDVCISEQIETENHPAHTLLPEDSIALKMDEFASEDQAIIQDERYDGVLVKKQDNDESVNNNCETSVRMDSEVFEDNKQCENSAIEMEKEVGKEASTSIQSQPAEKPMQVEPDNVAQGSNLFHENKTVDRDCETSSEQVLRNEIDCGAVNLGKEDGSENVQNNIVEHIREKFENLTLPRKETFQENEAAAGYVGAEESSEWNGGPTSSKSRIQAQTNSSSSMLLDEKPKGNVVEEEEELNKNGISDHNMTLQHRDNRFLPRIPFPTRSSEVVSEIYEQRRYMERRRYFEATWRKRDSIPMHYDDETSGEINQKQRYYHGYNDRRSQAERLSISSNLPRRRHSGEMYNRRWSTQLPSGPPRAPPADHYRQFPMPYMDQYGHPYLTNPQRYLDSRSYGWAYDTVYLSGNQKYIDWIMKRRYMRNKQRSVKRQLKPIAGGAPFITCHFCLRVLKLPEEFLICKQTTYHRLKCGACSAILEFSLANESNLAPLVHSKEHEHILVSKETHTNGKEFQHDSFRKSSRENTNLSTRSATYGERRGKTCDDNEVTSPSRRSRKVNMTGERPARSKSPLHQLMGYSSPQDLWKARTDSDKDLRFFE